MKRVLGVCCLVACSACGSQPATLGITTNVLNTTKTRLGPSPDDLASRAIEARGYRQADLVDDAATELLVWPQTGKVIEVRSASGAVLRTITTEDYITDFEVLQGPDGAPEVVVATYPNATWGMTFTVLDRALKEVAHWEEHPVPSGGLSVANWNGTLAVFYLQDDALVIRSARGQALGRLPAPEGATFSRLHVLNLDATRIVVVASGDGYTPFHSVTIYDTGGRLLFNEVGEEHAFELSPSNSGFVVATRSTRWGYEVPRL